MTLGEPDDPSAAKLVETWTRLQLDIASKAIFSNHGLSFDFSDGLQPETLMPSLDDVEQPLARSARDARLTGLQAVGGLYISYPRHAPGAGVATLTVLQYPSLQVLHTLSRVITLETPYLPSFLSIRESEPLVKLIRAYRDSGCSPFPDVFLVDGNGRFHVRQAGLAVHIGVMADVPTIGVAKEYHPIVSPRLEQRAGWRTRQKEFKAKCKETLVTRGQYLHLYDATGDNILGAALLTSKDRNAKQPVSVSPGHRISLETAIHIALGCSSSRVPEPIRQADMTSREMVRKEFGAIA